MKYFNELFRYNFKILSGMKYRFMIFFFLLIPFSLNFVGEDTYSIIFEMIMPVIGIFLYSDIMLIDDKYGAYENFFIAAEDKKRILFVRTCIVSLYGILGGVISYVICIIMYPTDQISLLYLFLLCILFYIINMVFFGMISLLGCSLTNNSFIGYIVGFLSYSIFWLKSQTLYVFNPFSFSNFWTENFNIFIINKIIIIAACIILFFINIKLCSKSKYNKLRCDS